MHNSTKKYHVMHIVDSLEMGGMENGVVNLANHIDQGKFRFSICCLSHPGRLSNRINADNVSLISLGWPEGFRPNRIFELARVFKSHKVDIIHTHGWQTLIYSSLAAIIAGVPVFINGEHGRFHLEKYRRRVAYKIISLIVDRYISVSYSLENELTNILSACKEKIVTIPNGVDLRKFYPLENEEVAKTKTGLGIANSALIIGTVGRLEPQKNVDLLLRVFAKICNVRADLHCVLIGDGFLRENLEKLSLELGVKEKVHFVGRVDNPHQMMSILDIFVSASRLEGTSNAILEAMACGKPIVAAADVGDNGKLVEEGVNGFLVLSEDADSFENAINKLLTDEELRKKFANRSRVIADVRFDIMKMICRYQDIYLKSIGSKRGNNDF